MNYKYRLFIILVIFVSFYYTKPWFILIFTVFSLKVNFNCMVAILFVSYIFLEYHEYKTKQYQNEFYYFIFWFIALILIFSLYIAIIQAFNTFINPKDYLIHTNYFSINIKYTENYKIMFFYQSLEMHFSSYDNNEHIKNIYEIAKSVDIGDILNKIHTIHDVEKMVSCCSQIALDLYLASFYYPDTILFNIILEITKKLILLGFCFKFISVVVAKPLLVYIFKDLFHEWIFFIIKKEYNNGVYLDKDFIEQIANLILNAKEPLIMLTQVLAHSSKQWFDQEGFIIILEHILKYIIT